MNIEDHIDKLNDACKRFNIRRLYLVGSFASGKNTEESDVDFLVSFNELSSDGIADRYFGFLDFLKEEFHADVDLIEESAIKNPFFRNSINRNRKLIYG
jgi:predicted nucleotidyltransferase